MFPFWIDFSFASVMQLTALIVAFVSWLAMYVTSRGGI